MENNEKPANLPEFPLAAYRGLSQTLPLSLEDGHCSEEIVCSTVSILPTGDTPRKPSSMMTLKSEVDFTWEDRYYIGQLVAMHWTGWVLAYVIIDRETSDGAVRVISKTSGGRALIKGMKGCVHDLAFSQNDGETLLSIIDENGTLFVYRIEDKGPSLNTRKVFQLKTDVKPKPDYCNRVIWVCYAPEEEMEDQRRLAILIGSKALVCHIGKLEIENKKSSNEWLLASDVKNEALLVVDGHCADIMYAEFSPDASALATVSLDGTMQFFQIYMDQKPKCLHNWRPHEGQPLTFLSFLDNHVDSPPDGQIWKFVVTGAKNNTELKVWNCTEWSHIQTISVGKEGQNLKLKAALDMSASFLVLSDQYNRIVYLFKINIGPNQSSAHIESVSAYVVPFPVLSFVILGLIPGFYDEDDSDYEGCDEPFEEVKTLSMHMINPKSLLECKLNVLSPPRGKELTLTTLVPDQPELPQPFTLMTPSECASAVKVEPELNDGLVELDAVEADVSGASSPSQEVCDILNLKESNETPRSFSSEPNMSVIAHNGFDLKVNKNSPTQANEVPITKESPLTNTSSRNARTRRHPTMIKTPTMKPVAANEQELEQRVQKLEQLFDLKAVERLLEAQTTVLSNLEKREANELAQQENLRTSYSKMIDNLITTKLQEIVPSEIKKQIVPLIAEDMEVIKRNVQAEFKQQMSTTDQLLKENISKLVQNKSVTESLAASVSSSVRNSLSETCKDLMMNFILPRMEKVLDNTFLQVNDAFASGVRECVMKLREDTDKVREGMKQSENSLRQATDLNKKSLVLLPQELEKSLLSIGNQIKIQLNETIQRELKTNSIIDQATTISRAMTPAMLTKEKRVFINQLFASEQYNSAFQEALSASDLNLVVFACEKIPAEQLFASSLNCPLQQPVLLSLIQQLTTDLGKNSELKSSYLMEAVLRLEVHHPTTREFLPKVISEVERNISTYLATQPKDKKVCSDLNRTLMIVRLLNGQINSRS